MVSKVLSCTLEKRAPCVELTFYKKENEDAPELQTRLQELSPLHPYPNPIQDDRLPSIYHKKSHKYYSVPGRKK